MMLNIDAEVFKLYPQVIVMRDGIAFDLNNNQVDYDLALVTSKAKKELCKQQAKKLLAKSDWSVLPDVGLANQDAFVFYRLNLRNLVLNPITDPVFEPEPIPIWQ